MRFIAAFALLAGLTIATPAPSQAAGWCMPRLGNPTPCTVTHAEWGSVQVGETRHDVRHAYGVRGQRVNWFWSPMDGWFHVVVQYPTGTQDVTWVDYRDVHDRGVFTVYAKGWDYQRVPTP